MKSVILAGGYGTRMSVVNLNVSALNPATTYNPSVSKHLRNTKYTNKHT